MKVETVLKKYYLEIVTIILFLVTRIVNLGIIPIFTDEAIYSYWSQVALHDPANRYISLVDGKQPLFIWFGGVLQAFIKDPLIATRSVSVFAGAISLVGIFLLTKELFDKKLAKFASFVYVILPFTLLYDRMALYDSLLTGICIFSIYFSVKLAKNPRTDYSLLTGISLGLALMTKSSAELFLYLLPLPLIVASFKKGEFLKHIKRYVPFALLSVFISQVMYNSLRLSPLFYMIARKNMEFIRPIPEALKNPFSYFFSNANAMTSWLVSYIGFPLMIIFAVTAIYGFYSRNKKIILLSIYSLFPFAVETVFNKVLYPRFMLFYFPYVIILSSFGIFKLFEINRLKNWSKTLILILIFLYPAANSILVLTNPPLSKIADSDYQQYINSWPAGYGVKEVVQILRSDGGHNNVYVATEGTFGLLPYALNIYFYGYKSITIAGYWPVDTDNLPQQVLEAAKSQKTYFLFNENQKQIENRKLSLVASFQKGIGKSYMRLYEVK